jgi:glutaminyl-peptide cyclotransferase
MLNSKTLFSIALLLIWTTCSCCNGARSQAETQQPNQMTVPSRVTTFSYEVLSAYPHDPDAFTQGLVFYQGMLYESTGLNGASSLRRVELETGKVLQKVDVPSAFFAEGLALFNSRLYQLTWQTQQGFVYDFNSFNLIRGFNYTGEGWGLTHDERSLIMSDGTDQIRFLNPDTFEVQRVIRVQDNGREITELNELEYIKGEIYANIWQTDRIARIDPQSGRVIAWIDLSGLLPPEDRTRPVDVLNGIAYDETSDRIFVTGKLWPKLFVIRLKARRTDVSR